MPALEQIREVIREDIEKISEMELFARIVKVFKLALLFFQKTPSHIFVGNIYDGVFWKNSNADLNTLTILAKSSIWDIWDPWLGPE